MGIIGAAQSLIRLLTCGHFNLADLMGSSNGCRGTKSLVLALLISGEARDQTGNLRSRSPSRNFWTSRLGNLK